jgi:hypothetical protein
MATSGFEPFDIAQTRHRNALRLFDEFVRQHVRSTDAVALRGLERRFAEHLLVQPSYWSQVKSRTRQIGERLARRFEQRCRKSTGWMDREHHEPPPSAGLLAPPGPLGAGIAEQPALPDAGSMPCNDEERFVTGLLLTYYRRDPQRARSRLLELLGEVLAPLPSASTPAAAAAEPPPARRRAAAAQPGRKPHD